MLQKLKLNISVFFTFLLLGMISAPTVILSFDDSVDVSFFYSISEEEEESESLKLAVEEVSLDYEDVFFDINQTEIVGYTYRTYSKPHLNIISPPPDFIL